VAGGFDEPHYTRLINSKNLINSIAQQILEAHFTESIQEELADELGFDLLQIRKQRDPLFRQQVLRAYNYQCAVCGFNMRHDNTSVALEAAHIKWKQFGGPCEIANGLALCSIHHKAFDKGSLGVDENMRVQISSAVNGNSVVSRFFWDFAGTQIHLPLQKENYPQANYIEWHIREIFRK
ncbi:HNH endonuclease, partial [Enterobacter roggenkampii]|nr:HNH endonuclease [Enterobacter roggenkampii]